MIHSSRVLGDLAPMGALRAAINLVHPVLARSEPAPGARGGVRAALAGELARWLGVPLELVVFHGANSVVQAAGTGAWNVAFLAIDPARASHVTFTAPYAMIEGGFAVPAGSPARVIADVDRAGTRIAVGDGSAYELYLRRTLQHATLVRAPAAGTAVLDRFLAEQLEAMAGVKPGLAALVERRPALRLVQGSFMEIRQAMCTAVGRHAGHRYLRDFVAEMTRSGFVARALQRGGRHEAVVAPPKS